MCWTCSVLHCLSTELAEAKAQVHIRRGSLQIHIQHTNMSEYEGVRKSVNRVFLLRYTL